MQSETSSTEIERRATLCAWSIDACTALVLTLWYYRYGVGQLGTHLYDTFDQKAVLWCMEWLYHSFFGTGHLANVFDANILYPHANVLAWSETFIGFLPFYVLPRLVTNNPIAAMNLMAMTGVFVSGVAMGRLARLLTGTWAPIAATLGSIGLIVGAQEGHIQFKCLGLLVWLIYFFARFLQTRSERALAACIVLFAWLFLSSIYFAIMFVVMVVTIGGVVCLRHPRPTLTWFLETVRGLKPLWPTASVIVIGLPLGWVLHHYMKVKSEFGLYSFETFVPFSARVSSFIDAAPQSLVYDEINSDWGSHETRLCFGFMAYFLASIGFVRGRKLLDQRRFVAGILGATAMLAAVLALGPYSHDGLDAGHEILLPAYAYGKLFPGFSAMRTIGRFGLFMAVCLAPLADFGARELARLVSERRVVAYGLIAAFVLLEQTLINKPFPVEVVAHRDIYEALAALTPENAAVLELPVARSGHMDSIDLWHDQMMASTVHWRRIPSGFTSQNSSVLDGLTFNYRGLLAGTLSAEAFLAHARTLRFTHLLVNPRLLTPAEYDRFRSAFAKLGLLQKDAAGAALFELPAAEVSR